MANILLVRDQWVLLDREAAAEFQTETRVVNQAVSRNAERFTEEFAFKLTPDETEAVRSQLVMSNPDLVKRLRTPRVFTEEGIVLLATVLKSDAAVRATKYVIRTFVEVQRKRREGENAPPLPDVTEETAADTDRSPLRGKLDAAIKKLADVALSDAEQLAVIGEAQQIRDDGLSWVHETLRKPFWTNSERAANVQRQLAETEGIQLDNREKKRLALIRDLLLIIELERANASGDLDSMSRTLRDLSGLDRAED